jgi:hypothetical protein
MCERPHRQLRIEQLQQAQQLEALVGRHQCACSPGARP